MIIRQNKNEARYKRHLRSRRNIFGTAQCPRMNVYRSTVHIYVQLIDDTNGATLCSSSTVSKGLNVKGMKKAEAAAAIGADIAKKAKKAGIENVVFDRGGYLYTGRVRALADGARAEGLKF